MYKMVGNIDGMRYYFNLYVVEESNKQKRMGNEK